VTEARRILFYLKNNMKRLKLASVFLFIMSISSAQTNDLQKYYGEARAAYKAGDHVKFYTAIIEANKIHPYHQGVLYHCAIAAALNNKPEEAISFLTRATQIKADYDLQNPDFKSLEGKEKFEALKHIQKETLIPRISSDTAFVIHDRSLHLECIAAGKAKGEFYLGSIHKRKIIKVNSNGEFTDFATSGSNGLTSVFGIKVDASKNILWACSSPMEETEGFDSTLTSAVFKYDLRSGKLIRKYEPEQPSGHIFGDLTLSPDGGVYVSDSKMNHIYKVNETTGKLEDFFSFHEFWNLQGISFSTKGDFLFIADYIKGIFRLELKNKSLKFLPAPEGISMKGIDGLVFHDNQLITIQNAIVPMRVTRFGLDKGLDNISSFEIIDRGHPAFNEPTIGCISQNEFYYIANSLWSGYTDDHKLKSEEALQDVVVLKAKLKP
jgi:hypothetical protein